MLSFSLVAEALTGLIYHRPSGENSKFAFGTDIKMGIAATLPELSEWTLHVGALCIGIYKWAQSD